MNDQNLYLVGVVHCDLDGEERLKKILNELRPSIIALEFHKERETFLSKQSPEEIEREINAIIDKYKLNLTPRQKETFIESERILNNVMGYEIRVSRDYKKRNPDSRLEYIDIPLNQEFIKGCTEALEIEFKQLVVENPKQLETWLKLLDGGIEKYKKEYLIKSIQQLYQDYKEMGELFETEDLTFEEIEDMTPQAIQALKQIYNPRRNEAMAARIRELYDGNSRLVAIVGLYHLVGLEKRLKDLKPKVITLLDYDSI